MRRALWSISAFVLTVPLRTQDPAAELRAVEWSRDEVGVGVRLSRYEFAELFGAPQSIAVLELDAGVRIDVVDATGRERTSEMAQDAGALAAVNGGFFDTGNGDPVGLLRIDGELLNPATAGQGSFGVDVKGRVRVAARSVGDWTPMIDALGAGPILVSSGKVLDHGERQRTIRHPRTALGVRGDGSVVLAVVDGRTDKAAGMSFEELATVLIAFGCDDAVNLDGGGSSTMWILGPGIVNHPSDNKKFDARGERAVANAVLVTAPAVLVVDEEVATFAGGAFEVRDGGKDSWRGDFAVHAGDGEASARWSLRVPRPGKYAIQARWPRVPGVRAGEVAVRVGELEAVLDQRTSHGRWNEMGEIEAGDDPVEMVWRSAGGRALVLDGVRLVERR